jgi:hypothetical protein
VEKRLVHLGLGQPERGLVESRDRVVFPRSQAIQTGGGSDRELQGIDGSLAAEFQAILRLSCLEELAPQLPLAVAWNKYPAISET